MRDRVTVGIPVYNGERFLAEAVRSVQEQTYGDLEIIVSDNASTDSTGEIALAAAASDSRIRYIRQERNLGGRVNTNLLVHAASSPLFKWAHYDDVCAPDLVADCVATLTAAPDAVLAIPRVLGVDEAGAVLTEYDDAALGMDDPRPHVRLRRLYRTMAEQALFGVIHTAALQRTHLYPRRLAPGTILLTELALQGPMPQTSSQVQHIRHHGGRHSAGRSSEFRWVGDMRRRDRVFAYTRVTRALLDAVAASDLDPAEKRRCRSVILRDWTVGKLHSTASDLRHLAGDLRRPS